MPVRHMVAQGGKPGRLHRRVQALRSPAASAEQFPHAARQGGPVA